MPLSAADILHAFDALAAELARRGEHAQIAIAGGAALVLLFEARDTTKDVDAYFFRPEASILRDAAAHVATELQLPKDWLNDAAKGYFVDVTLGALLYGSPSLEVRAVTMTQLLAMKLAAWRDAVDRSDAQLLLRHMDSSKAELWQRIERLVSPRDLQKASYAFDDLWEIVNGPS